MSLNEEKSEQIQIQIQNAIPRTNDELYDTLQSFARSNSEKIIQYRLRIIIFVALMILVMIFEVHINHYWYISLIWFILLTSLLIFLLYIDLIDGHEWYQNENKNKRRGDMWPWMLTHFDNNLLSSSKDSTSYSCSICWLFDVHNNIGLLYDDRLLWIIAICFDVLFFCQILIYYNFNEQPINTLCKIDHGMVDNDSIESGACFIRKEYGYNWYSMVMLVTGYSLISTIDVSSKFIQELKNVQKKIMRVYNLSHDKTECVIYQLLSNSRKSKKEKLHNRRKYMYVAIVAFCLIYSPHLIWYEIFDLRHDLTKCITNSDNQKKALIIFIYLISVIINVICPIITLATLYKIYEIYTDFESITSVFCKIIRDVNTERIKYWWSLRQFYYNYVNTFYFAISNGIYGMILLMDLFLVTVLLYWTLQLYLWPRTYNVSYVYGYLAFSTFLITIIFTTYTSLISYHIAFVYPKRQKHIQMLLYLKNKTILKGNDILCLCHSIDMLCEIMDKYDRIPTIFCITITPKKLYVFFAYILTAFSTILSKLLF